MTLPTDRFALNSPQDSSDGMEMLAQAVGDDQLATDHWFVMENNYSWWILLLVAMTFIGICWYLYRHERGGTQHLFRMSAFALRAIVIVVLVLLLPNWSQQRSQKELPELAIVIDVSRSMDHIDLERTKKGEVRLGELSRSSRIRNYLERNRASLGELENRYRLRWYVASDRAIRVSSEAELWNDASKKRVDREVTQLGNSLDSILTQQRGTSTAAIVWLTDGVSTDGQSLSQALLSAPNLSPLFLLGVGSDRPSCDFSLSDLRADESVFVDDLITFRANLRAQGLAGSEAIVTLQREGEEVILDQQEIRIEEDDAFALVSLSHRPSIEGDHNYVITAIPHERELNIENNSLATRVSVRDEMMNILLVASQPSYEFRALKQMLEREMSRSDEERKPSVSLSVLLQNAQLLYSQNDRTAIPVFPIRDEELFGFDVVILCDPALDLPRNAEQGLGRLEQESLQRFVKERGGSIVLLFGPQYLPAAWPQEGLSNLLPAPKTSFAVPSESELRDESAGFRLTRFGKGNPVFQIEAAKANSIMAFESLEGAYWRVGVEQLKPGVLVMAEFDELFGVLNEDQLRLPAITMQRIGPGIVWTHLFDESYRWHNQITRVYYQRYWLQTLRFLSRGKLLGQSRWGELRTDQRVYSLQEQVLLQLEFYDLADLPEFGPVQVKIIDEADQELELELRRDLERPGVFETSTTGLKAGKYKVEYQDFDREELLETVFEVKGRPGEFEQLEVDRDELATAAKVTGGKFVPLAEADSIWQDLPKGSELSVARLPSRSIWELPKLATLIAFVFFASLAAEWILRRKMGLI